MTLDQSLIYIIILIGLIQVIFTLILIINKEEQTSLLSYKASKIKNYTAAIAKQRNQEFFLQEACTNIYIYKFKNHIITHHMTTYNNKAWMFYNLFCHENNEILVQNFLYL